MTEPVPSDSPLLKKPLDEMGYRELSDLCKHLDKMKFHTPEESDLFARAIDELISLDMSMGSVRRDMAKRAAEAMSRAADSPGVAKDETKTPDLGEGNRSEE